MIILGLTGSIAMGKSTAAAMFRRLGVPVFDADHSVHRHLADDRQAIAKIAAVFPGVVREGRIDRAALAAAVFGDDAALDRLERILHPLVDADQEGFLKIAARHGAALVVLDIPLLFETGRERHCDRVAVVSAPWFVQLQRLKARPGMDRRRLETTLARQMPDAEKRRRADYVIPTGRSRGETMRVITRIVKELRTAAACRRRRGANDAKPFFASAGRLAAGPPTSHARASPATATCEGASPSRHLRELIPKPSSQECRTRP